ncbi:MAG: hypothetical protein ABJH45_15575 [Paracoccaceae bacterium]
MTGVKIALRSFVSKALTAQITLEDIAADGRFDVALPRNIRFG